MFIHKLYLQSSNILKIYEEINDANNMTARLKFVEYEGLRRNS